jgi:3',5'-cyclic-AMP phosphodiesterase
MIMMNRNLPHRALTFVHMSDPHVGHHALAEATFERALADVAALRPRPEFILLTGDLTEGERDHYRAFRRIASGSPVPIVALPGNHDVGNRLSDRSLPLIDLWRSEMGPDWLAFSAGAERNATRFILLNSLFLRAPSRVRASRSPRLAGEADAQWEFLERSLADATRGPCPAESVFIAFHHTPYAMHPDEFAGGYLPISRDSRRRILDLARRFHVQAILSGHAHWSREVTVGGVSLITTPSVAFNSPFGPSGKLPLGYRVFTVAGDHFFHRYKSLDLAGMGPFWVIGLRQPTSDGRWLDHLGGVIPNSRVSLSA